MCAEPNCESPRPLPAKQKQKMKEKYCPLRKFSHLSDHTLVVAVVTGEPSANRHTTDTCREKECHEFVDDLCLFCKDRPSPPKPLPKHKSTN